MTDATAIKHVRCSCCHTIEPIDPMVDVVRETLILGNCSNCYTELVKDKNQVVEENQALLRRPSLFRSGHFVLNSGKSSTFKIDCDSLTDDDITSLARMALDFLPHFGSVEGVPRGGLRLAEALAHHATGGPLLVADDVCSTGASLERQRNGRDAIGLVIFSRGPCPSWATPIFRMST